MPRNAAGTNFETDSNPPAMPEFASPFTFSLSRRALLRRAAFVTAIAAVASVAACGSDDTPTSTTPSVPASETFAPSLGVNIAAMTKKSDNLYYQDLTVGGGALATVGRTVTMNYTGWLANGTRFDGGQYSFPLGAGQVIAGWDQGIQGMKVGGKRRLVIGSELGYGSRGSGPIPANATLVFDVEFVSQQ